MRKTRARLLRRSMRPRYGDEFDAAAFRRAKRNWPKRNHHPVGTHRPSRCPWGEISEQVLAAEKQRRKKGVGSPQ